MNKKLFLPNALNVGVEEIDSEHRVLVDLINHGISLWNEGERDSAKFAEIFTEFVDRLSLHFHEEELLMARVNYPELKQHAGQHYHIMVLLRHMEKHKELFELDDLIFCFDQIIQDIAHSDLHFADYTRSHTTNFFFLSEKRSE